MFATEQLVIVCVPLCFSLVLVEHLYGVKSADVLGLFVFLIPS